jgi:hypothetical protein
VTHHDKPHMAMEAELLHILHRGGIPLHVADRYTLWENAAALGMHRVETVAQRDEREVVDTKREYWEETQAQRQEKLAGYAERRKQRELERRQARRKVS